MQKITKLIGVDSKAGRRSRTGSTITMGISDLEAIQCQQYFMAIEQGEEPTGKIKKIELVLYGDSEKIETIESLRAEIKELKESLEVAHMVVNNADILEEVLETDTAEEIEEKLKLNKIAEKLNTGNLEISIVKEEPKMKIYTNKDFGIQDNEELPSNQPDLKMTDQYPNVKKDEAKKCTCNSPAFVNGKCANCGGVE